jgi:hypothetical protein
MAARLTDDRWSTEEFARREIRLSVNASFTQELLAIAAVLAVLLLGLFAIWAADEVADRVVAIAVAVMFVLGLISHGRRHGIPTGAN